MPDNWQSKLSKSGYLSEDTIAAVASGLGGPVAIIRASGPESLKALRALAKLSQDPEPRTVFRADIKASSGAIIDQALVTYFKAPQSYTGEDVVEFHVHGNALLIETVLEELARYGVRQALPGEFSFRAVRNGKLSLTQAQAVADLISASNENALALALEKLSGAQNQQVQEISGELKTLLALSEVGIDFSDQDVEEVSLPALKKRNQAVLSHLEKMRASFRRGNLIQEGVSVALIGPPNAGKSSLFNALLGQDRAIVSEIAGTTRDVISERFTFKGKRSSVTFRLLDTAGIHHTGDRVEGLGIERSLKSAEKADLILFLADGEKRDDKACETLWQRIGSPTQKTIGVVTKKDLIEGSWHPKVDLLTWVETSAVTGQGIPDTAEAMARFCESWVSRDPKEVLLTRIDHLSAVTAAMSSLERATLAQNEELFSADIRHALHELQPLIGETLTDDILGKIFSEFCIGK